MKTTTKYQKVYETNWNALFAKLTDIQREIVLSAPDGSQSGILAMNAQEITDAAMDKWIAAIRHHATDSGRVELDAQGIEEAATGLREQNFDSAAEISAAEEIILGEVL